MNHAEVKAYISVCPPEAAQRIKAAQLRGFMFPLNFEERFSNNKMENLRACNRSGLAAAELQIIVETQRS